NLNYSRSAFITSRDLTLRAINAFLSQDNAYLESISVQAIVCEYLYDEINEIFSDAGYLVDREVIRENLLGFVRVEKIEGQYDWSDFEQSALVKTKSLSLGVERGIATQQARIDADVILNYFLHPRNRNNLKSVASLRESGIHELAEDMSRHIRMWQVNSSRAKRSELKLDSSHLNLQNIKLENIEQILLDHYKFAREIATKQIQDALFNTLAIELSDKKEIEEEVSRGDFISTLQTNRLRLVEALSDNSKNEFKNSIISKLTKLDDEASYDAVYQISLLKTLLWNMMQELRFEQLLLRSVNLLTEKFNDYLIDGKKLQISNDRIYVEVDGRELQVSDLSSGERHILTFLTLVLFQGRERNFLIIDEPEISLNIKWQRELMGLLHNLAPHTQIIVASHSPILAKRNPSFLSELIVNKGAQ
ncbi:AAA family ATPase, partial [Aquabacterium sp.]|uniref:AAA family ATPase n=1 Tax=Aquabacterium sp. TaxID=1872578 RepID=UPI0024871169